MRQIFKDVCRVFISELLKALISVLVTYTCAKLVEIFINRKKGKFGFK